MAKYPLRIRKAVRSTPVPQPFPPRFLWGGSVKDARDAAALGLLNKEGFTEEGLRLHSELTGDAA